MADAKPVNGEDTPSAPLSWRDVYKAVGDSEARVIAAVNAAVAPLTESAADHERRLRTMEAAVAPLAITAIDRDARLVALEAETGANTKAIDRFLFRESGVFSTLGAGKTIIVVLAALIGPVVAVISLATR